MTSRTTFFAKIMLVIWLAATNHAVFELAGVMDTEFAPVTDLGQQRWHQVEDSLTKQKTDLPTKPASVDHVFPILELLLAEVEETRFVRVEAPAVDADTNAFHTWHFVQRAAPLPGAPSTAV